MSVTLHTTHGDIKLQLHCNLVPRPSFNFLALCARRSFDHLPFHRVVRNYIIQSGDPTGLGNISDAAIGTLSTNKKGTAPKQQKQQQQQYKRLPDHIVSELTFDDGDGGVLAFANGGKPSKRGVGSQFFITCGNASHLNGTCTIVGRVIHGMSVVHAIADLPVDDRYRPIAHPVDDDGHGDDVKQGKEREGEGEGGRTEEKFNGMPKIINVTVHANPFATGLVALPAD